MVRIVVAAFVGAAILAAPTAASTKTGLYGVVRKGPTQPVCSPDVPCTAPAAKVRLDFHKGSRNVIVTTASNGAYRVVLAAGHYTVSVVGAKTRITPQAVTIVTGRMRRVNLMIDTGIR